MMAVAVNYPLSGEEKVGVAPTDNVNSKNDVIGGRKTYNSIVLFGPNGEDAVFFSLMTSTMMPSSFPMRRLA